MSKQVVLVTGALSGIGRATAVTFAKAGAEVVIAGRNAEEGKRLAAALTELGAAAEFVKTDVRFEDQVEALVDRTIARFGRLDVAVNNAATEGTIAPLTSHSSESYAATFDTNVLGVLLSMKHELRVMLPNHKGSIINVSSTLGHQGVAGASLYVASKHAVEGLSKSAALEYAGTGVRINLVAPGPVETGMLNRFTGTSEGKSKLIRGVPLKRIGEPEEIAAAIQFLASDAASFVTGHSLAVDGGKLAGEYRGQ